MFWCVMAGVWVWEDWAEWSVRWYVLLSRTGHCAELAVCATNLP